MIISVSRGFSKHLGFSLQYRQINKRRKYYSQQSVGSVYSLYQSGCQFLQNLTLFIFCSVSFFSELVEAARKALISRVVELTDDRSALKLEVSSLQETVSRLEGRMKEKEEETKRCGRWF